MAVEAPEILINRGRVQEHCQPAGQRLGQSALVLVEQVQVVLEAQYGCVTERARLDHARHDSAFFFLGREAANDTVEAARVQPFFGIGVAFDGIGLLHALDRP
ncbi:MAG: hypothetical protein DDT34_02129 [Firmicutes bacterium]|nr:hypothetical protein [Bacillota bacterium]